MKMAAAEILQEATYVIVIQDISAVKTERDVKVKQHFIFIL